MSVTCMSAMLALGGCHHPEKTIKPAEAILHPAAPEDGEGNATTAATAAPEMLPYALAPADELSIRVVEDTNLDTTVRIDSDGGFQFPYAGRVRAEGLTTVDVNRKIEKALQEFYVTPHVTVNLTSQEQQYVNVMGEVNRPGRIGLRSGMRIVDAIAEASGPTLDAAQARVILIRRVGQDDIRAGYFDYQSAMLNPMGGAWASNIPLQRGDMIFLPRNGRAQWTTAFQFISTMFGAAVDAERAVILYPDVREILKTGDAAGRSTVIVR